MSDSVQCDHTDGGEGVHTPQPERDACLSIETLQSPQQIHAINGQISRLQSPATTTTTTTVIDMPEQSTPITSTLGPTHTDRHPLQPPAVVAELESDAVVQGPLDRGEDRTLWLAAELLIMILLRVPIEALWDGACSPCRRWHQLTQSIEVQRRKRGGGGRWDAYANRWIQPRTLVGHVGPVRTLAVGPNGMVYSGSDDGTVKVWALSDSASTPVHTLHCFPGQVSAVAIGHDGTVYTGSPQTMHVQVWSSPTAESPRRLVGHTLGITSLCVDGDSKLYSGSVDSTVRVWSTTAESHCWTLKGHSRAIRAVVVAGNDRVVSASDDRTLRVWSSEDGTLLFVLHGHTGSVCSLVAGVNNTVYSGSFDRTVSVWSTEDGSRICRLRHRRNPVLALACGADHRVYTGVWDGRVSVWAGGTDGSHLHTAYGRSAALSLAVAQDGRVLCGSADHAIRVW
jgi:F-box/WD-40 domain protein 7